MIVACEIPKACQVEINQLSPVPVLIPPPITDEEAAAIRDWWNKTHTGINHRPYIFIKRKETE